MSAKCFGCVGINARDSGRINTKIIRIKNVIVMNYKYNENSYYSRLYLRRFFEEAVNSQQKQNGALKKEKMNY